MKYLILDCDGVLTDGKKNVSRDGKREFISFHSRDNEAIEMFIDVGFEVIIVTASTFPGINKYWIDRGPMVLSGVKNKGVFLDDVVNWSEAICVGDDLIDFTMLNRSAFAFVPQDAHPALKETFDVLDTPGGGGVVGELWSIYSKMLNYGVFSGASLKIDSNKPLICGALRGYNQSSSKNGN